MAATQDFTIYFMAGMLFSAFAFLVMGMGWIWSNLKRVRAQKEKIRQEEERLQERRQHERLRSQERMVEEERIKQLESELKEQRHRQEILEFEQQQEQKGLIRVYRGGRYMWIEPEAEELTRRVEVGLQYNFPELNQDSFVDFCMEVFGRMGYACKKVEGKSVAFLFMAVRFDQRVLVRAEKRDKHELVDVAEVNELIRQRTSQNASKAIYIATSGFTDEARRAENLTESMEALGIASQELGELRTKKQKLGKPLELWDGQHFYSLVERYYLQSR